MPAETCPTDPPPDGFGCSECHRPQVGQTRIRCHPLTKRHLHKCPYCRHKCSKLRQKRRWRALGRQGCRVAFVVVVAAVSVWGFGMPVGSRVWLGARMPLPVISQEKELKRWKSLSVHDQNSLPLSLSISLSVSPSPAPAPSLRHPLPLSPSLSVSFSFASLPFRL